MPSAVQGCVGLSITGRCPCPPSSREGGREPLVATREWPLAPAVAGRHLLNLAPHPEQIPRQDLLDVLFRIAALQ